MSMKRGEAISVDHVFAGNALIDHTGKIFDQMMMDVVHQLKRQKRFPEIKPGYAYEVCLQFREVKIEPERDDKPAADL